MLDPTLRALFVTVLIVILRFAFQALGIPVSDEILATLAAAIIAWIFGNPAGQATAKAIHTYRAGLTRWGREMIGALNGLSILFSSPTAVQQIEAGDRAVGLKLVRFERALAACTTTVRALGPPPTVYELVHSHALRACTSLEKGARLVKQGVREFQSGLGVDRFTEAAGPLNDGQGDIGLVRSELKPAAS